MNDALYLDYNASAPMRPEVLDVVTNILAAPHNASSVHSYGREGRRIIEQARSDIAAIINVPPAQLIFNSGATEANNTVLHHFAGEKIAVCAASHLSILDAAEHLVHIPVDENGLTDLTALEDILKTEAPALVSIMLVNNETGAIQPVTNISALAKRHGALVHCDAVQAIGRIPVDINALGVDFISLSAHKIGGPQGVGALALGLCGITPTMLRGGGQEKSARAGTENVAGIAGFGEAAKRADMDQYQSLQKMRDDLETQLSAISPEIIIHAKNAPRVAGTSMFSLPGISSETLLMALDLEGIALSNGSACSSGTVKASHVLLAMGASEDVASSALRLSMGWNTTPSDIEHFIESWSKIYERLKDRIKTHA